MLPFQFAEAFEKRIVPFVFAPWGRDLLARVRPAPTERVLDVACGTGIVARLVREALGPEARIAGVDLQAAMIAMARSLGPDIEWREGDAAALPFETASFDLVLCQQGLQFFGDRPAAAREMKRVLSPHGRVALSTWRAIEEQPLYQRIHQAALRHSAPPADRRFSLGEPNETRELLAGAGFRDVRVETVVRTDFFPDAAGFVALNTFALVPGFAAMPEEEQRRIVATMTAEARDALDEVADGAGLRHRVSANVVMASV